MNICGKFHFCSSAMNGDLAIDREFEYYEFFSFLKYNEFYEFDSQKNS